MQHSALAEKYFLGKSVISCIRLGHRSSFPKVRSKVEMDDRLEELIHYGPKWEALNTFLCTEKVNLEAAGPTVRPFGNFRKFSLQLEGDKEVNSHIASALLSTCSSHTSWQQVHFAVHQPRRAEVLGIRRKHPLPPHPRPENWQLLSVFQRF